MNILQQLDIQPDQTKPAVLSLRKSEKLAVLAIGLAAGQVMPEHQTKTDASLVVLQGKVQFAPLQGNNSYIPVTITTPLPECPTMCWLKKPAPFF